ncbi:TIGR00730 family Rossman fold protein [Sphingobacterium sp. SRCM116780]|uniref:LOG family protein n=1 Tax=Sphingobacterium sp. SRCM116780 TaxID=2907623 RepID=UPI001F324F2B|nr:TIGR00730 family Rossman fold protein [Sphingobacterium sp. SRCM116780]UIR55604.1 TIGR00730 family Rossman fold protein [Sphingobacterium sp. SRCM116780]
MKSVSVFCASSPGFDPIWMKEAYRVGQVLATQKIKLVYGGGQVGLMGAIADAVMENEGEVVGVIPHFLNKKEIAHHGITSLITVENMHERKMLMNDLCEGIIALPGGFGTMEELFEMITWGQLGLHKKPVGILNTNGFYDHLIAFIDNMVQSGLLKQKNQEMLLVDTNIESLLDKMINYDPPTVEKWMSSEGT